MTAEEYFDKNHIASKSHLSDNGLVYEEREVYKIMEAYHQAKLKEGEGKKEQCLHPRNEREYIGQNLLRCKVCGKEFN